MKITRITTYALEQDLLEQEVFAFSQKKIVKRSVLICKIETDDGFVGWGEAFGPCRIHKTIIDYYYMPFLLGKDPFDTAVIWDELYNQLRDNGQKGVTIQALSAVDIALWDIKGKVTGKPIYQLLGGAYREKIKPYATGMYRKYSADEIKETVSEAVSYIEQGFRAVKLKIGFGLEYDINLVKSVRETVGDSIDIMLDPNHAYNAMTAIEVGRAVQSYGITWYEEPVPPEDLEGYKEVKSKLEIPIAGGEAEFTRYGLNRFITERCAHIVQPDCTIMGGLSEYMKITTLCSIANTQCIPHVWGSGIALAVGIQAAFATPHFPPSLEPSEMWLEYDRTPNVFRDKLAIGIPKMEDGWISKPNKPGLGIEVDEDMLLHYSV